MNEWLSVFELAPSHMRSPNFKFQYADWLLFFMVFLILYSFISVEPYRITHPLDMENGYNNIKCTNIYNIQDFSAI